MKPVEVAATKPEGGPFWPDWKQDLFKASLGALAMAAAILPYYFDLRARVEVLEFQTAGENLVKLRLELEQLKGQVKNEAELNAHRARCAASGQVYDLTLLGCIDAPLPPAGQGHKPAS